MYFCIIALILFILEMFTGTFYLLVISVSMLSAGLTEWLFDTSTTFNAFIASIFSLIGIVVVRLWQRKHPQQTTQANIDVDYGQLVRLISQLDNNLWQVHYRGTIWQGSFVQQVSIKVGDNAQIVGHNGNILKLNKIPSTNINKQE